ncbi:hypothetical protein TWF694_011827 [Orbilia ellipsospora]|uniref:Uncharacterized protein n=1 Tax=Orbilia ellipsospora TaxID=2528407 RepID=A0AAV9X6E9_9PEZI
MIRHGDARTVMFINERILQALEEGRRRGLIERMSDDDDNDGDVRRAEKQESANMQMSGYSNGRRYELLHTNGKSARCFFLE